MSVAHHTTRVRAPHRRSPRHRDEPEIVTPVGVLDATTVQRLGEVVAADPRPVILDLSDCVVTCTNGELWARVVRTESVCFVCSRLSGRRILRRLTNGRRPVFETVAAAAQAVDPASGSFFGH